MVDILTGPRLARAVRAGALAVVREQETLNRINVFPVPDADTGNNLAATVRAVAAAVRFPFGISLGQTARLAADAALDGARGNSGAIFAQFLHGLADGIGNRVHITTVEFATAARRGSQSAEQALAQPVEGTILSVLRAWAAGLEENAKRVRDFRELWKRALVHAQEALANTPRQLQVLARHGVVDAGAQGFVYFLEGIARFFGDRKAADWQRAGLTLAQTTPFAAAHADFTTTYRFCSEGLLTGTQLDRKAIACAVAPLGDSLVVAGGGSRLRVHLHTNAPQRLFAILAGFGALERTKIDDMVLQQMAVRERSIAIVTDSTCDLPEVTAHALNLIRVPLSITFGDDSFTDGVTITAPEFYQRLATSSAVPKTSQPAVGVFRTTFAKLLEHHDAVISLHLTGALSGTYQAALAAARAVDPERIRVIDTRQIAGSLGLVVEAVGEAIAAGADLARIEALAREFSADSRLFAVLGSLDLAVRGGRVKPAVGRIARLLGLKPIFTVDSEGRGVPTGARVGFRSAVRSLVVRVARFAEGRPVRLLVCHANAVGAGEYLAELLARRFGNSEIPIVNLAPVLAAHVGPGSVAVGVRRLPLQS